MRKLLAYSLIASLVSSLFPQGHLDALFRVGHLVEHFAHHRQSDSTYDFSAFLSDHYTGDRNTADDGCHGKLPFRHPGSAQQLMTTAPALVPPPEALDFTPLSESGLKPAIIGEAHLLPSGLRDEIWQPPRA
ncbi:MAG: hypothetical protein KBF37_11350 [Saprospiraceae bacterium]|jgi:hypothetical protein|nr:hypothetical protein [Saprospiraceae bacterium]MBP9210902.1 hypothetical protein [Saprospiraceae bacterium]